MERILNICKNRLLCPRSSTKKLQEYFSELLECLPSNPLRHKGVLCRSTAASRMTDSFTHAPGLLEILQFPASNYLKLIDTDSSYILLNSTFLLEGDHAIQPVVQDRSCTQRGKLEGLSIFKDIHLKLSTVSNSDR